MHETALARPIVTIVADRARTEGSTAVRRIGIAVGALGHVEPEARSAAPPWTRPRSISRPRHGVEVLLPRAAPPGDGGLARRTLREAV